MARQVIVLGVQRLDNGSVRVSAVYWLTTPATPVWEDDSRQSAVPAFSTTVSWGITSAELTALRNGSVTEQGDSITLSSANATAANFEAAFASKYAAAQSALTSSALANKWVGASWDGTTWTAAP